jgi:hypothetical protein
MSAVATPTKAGRTATRKVPVVLKPADDSTEKPKGRVARKHTVPVAAPEAAPEPRKATRRKPNLPEAVEVPKGRVAKPRQPLQHFVATKDDGTESKYTAVDLDAIRSKVEADFPMKRGWEGNWRNVRGGGSNFTVTNSKGAVQHTVKVKPVQPDTKAAPKAEAKPEAKVGGRTAKRKQPVFIQPKIDRLSGNHKPTGVSHTTAHMLFHTADEILSVQGKDDHHVLVRTEDGEGGFVFVYYVYPFDADDKTFWTTEGDFPAWFSKSPDPSNMVKWVVAQAARETAAA